MRLNRSIQLVILLSMLLFPVVVEAQAPTPVADTRSLLVG